MPRLPKIGWIGWALLVGELGVLVKNHLGRLDADERRRLVEIVGKSRGRPSNLRASEKKELRKLVDQIEPRELARGLVSTATPFGKKRRRG
jgi:hypothetical protein